MLAYIDRCTKGISAFSQKPSWGTPWLDDIVIWVIEALGEVERGSLNWVSAESRLYKLPRYLSPLFRFSRLWGIQELKPPIANWFQGCSPIHIVASSRYRWHFNGILSILSMMVLEIQLTLAYKKEAREVFYKNSNRDRPEGRHIGQSSKNYDTLQKEPIWCTHLCQCSATYGLVSREIVCQKSARLVQSTLLQLTNQHGQKFIDGFESRRISTESSWPGEPSEQSRAWSGGSTRNTFVLAWREYGFLQVLLPPTVTTSTSRLLRAIKYIYISGERKLTNLMKGIRMFRLGT